MPVHDWTRVSAGTFHAFHLTWIAEMQRVLNGGLLPEGYYALAEQVANQVIPDVLTLQDLDSGRGTSRTRHSPDKEDGNVGVAIADAPPRMAIHDTASEAMLLAARRRHVV